MQAPVHPSVDTYSRHSQMCTQNSPFWCTDNTWTYYSCSTPPANDDVLRAELSGFSWCCSSTLSHHLWAQIFHSITCFSLRNYTLLTVTTLCIAGHHTCSIAAPRLQHAFWVFCLYCSSMNNSWSNWLWISGAVSPHWISVLLLHSLFPCIWQ